MKHNIFLRILAALLIPVCIFGLVAGVLGVKDVGETKEKKIEQRRNTLENIQMLEDGMLKLDENRDAYEQGLLDYAAGKQQLDAGRAKYYAGSNEFNQKSALYNEKMQEWNSKKAQLDNAKVTVADKKAQLEQGKAEYAEGLKQYQEGQAAYAEGKAKLDANTAKYQQGKILLAGMDLGAYPASKSLVNANEADIAAANAVLNNPDASDEEKAQAQAKLDRALKKKSGILSLSYTIVEKYETAKALMAEYEAGAAQLAAAEKQLAEAEQKLAAGKAKIDDAEGQLAAADKAIAENDQKLNSAKGQLDEAKGQLDAAQGQLGAGAAQLADGDKKLAEGKEKLDQFEDGEKKVKEGTEFLISKEDVKRVMAENPKLTPIEAARKAVDEATEKTTKELTARIVQYVALMAASALAIFASVFFLLVSGKGLAIVYMILGFLALAFAILGNAWGLANGYSEFKMQMIALIIVLVSALAFSVPLSVMLPSLTAKPEAAAVEE